MLLCRHVALNYRRGDVKGERGNLVFDFLKGRATLKLDALLGALDNTVGLAPGIFDNLLALKLGAAGCRAYYILALASGVRQLLLLRGAKLVCLSVFLLGGLVGVVNFLLTGVYHIFERLKEQLF